MQHTTPTLRSPRSLSPCRDSVDRPNPLIDSKTIVCARACKSIESNKDETPDPDESEHGQKEPGTSSNLNAGTELKKRATLAQKTPPILYPNADPPASIHDSK
jgi:hypothetical protein